MDVPEWEISLLLPVGLFGFHSFASLPFARISMAGFKLTMAAHRSGAFVPHQEEAAWDRERALG